MSINGKIAGQNLEKVVSKDENSVKVKCVNGEELCIDNSLILAMACEFVFDVATTIKKENTLTINWELTRDLLDGNINENEEVTALIAEGDE